MSKVAGGPIECSCNYFFFEAARDNSKETKKFD